MKLVLAALALLLPTVAFAQLGVGSTDALTLTLSPTYPRPGGAAIITPQSGTFDIANSTMVVTVNGKSVYTGNTQAISVPIGPAGQTTSIQVSVTSAGAIYSNSLSVWPTDVSLVAEPLSSAPPLYPGKPLIPNQGSVRVVAVADLRGAGGSRLDPNTLSYTWSADDTTLASASGIGKSALILPAPLQYRSEKISVFVQSKGGSIVGGDSLSVTPQTPSVRLYEDDPLSGILFDHALSGSFTITGAEATVIAVPYSFSLTNGPPSLNWFLNGSSAQTGAEITLRPTGTGTGSASLSLTASGSENVDAALSITFGATKTNFLGL